MTEYQVTPPACLAASKSHPPKSLVMPRGAWDTHAHVIGGDASRPLVVGRSYTPPAVSPAAYVAMLDTVGFDFGVTVQISVHGTDNRMIVDALRAHPTRLRGVVAIDGTESETHLLELREVGVCGVRLNELFAGGSTSSQLQRIAARCHELGWHLDLALHGNRLRALAPQLNLLDIPIVIDHMGWCAADKGIDQLDFQAGLDLVRLPNFWIKLSGAYRMSTKPWPYAEVGPFVRALAHAAPERTLWGTDWPHVALTDPARMPEPGALVDALARQLDDPALLHGILVNNPRRLYGLPGTPVNS